MFREKLGLNKAHNLKDLLSKAQSYINYKEKILAMGVNRGSRNTIPNQASKRYVDKHKKEGKHGPWSIFDT